MNTYLYAAFWGAALLVISDLEYFAINSIIMGIDPGYCIRIEIVLSGPGAAARNSLLKRMVSTPSVK